MSTAPVKDVDHLKGFHCLQVTIEFAQNLITTERKGVYCELLLLNSDSTAEYALRSEPILDTSATPSFDSRILLPFSAQRRLQFAIWGVHEDQPDVELGHYVLDLIPFSETKKSLAAKMKLKDRSQKEIGHLNVKVKMSAQELSQPSVAKYVTNKKPDQALLPLEQQLIDSTTAHSLSAIHVLVVDGEGFPNVERLSKLDPFVRVVVGSEVLKSPVQKNAGLNASFNTLFSMPYSAQKYLLLELWDQETLHADRQLGFHRIDLEHLMSNIPQREFISIPLTGKGGNGNAGTLRLYLGFNKDVMFSSASREDATLEDFPISLEIAPSTVERGDSVESIASIERTPIAQKQFHDFEVNQNMDFWMEKRYEDDLFDVVDEGCKTLRVHVFQARDLPNIESIGNIDPYVKITLGVDSLSTPKLRNAGSDAIFDSTFDFPFDGQRFLIFEVLDRQLVGHHRPLGRCAVSLANFFEHRGNLFDGSVQLFPYLSTPAPPTTQRNGTLYFRLEKKTIAVPVAEEVPRDI